MSIRVEERQTPALRIGSKPARFPVSTVKNRRGALMLCSALATGLLALTYGPNAALAGCTGPADNLTCDNAAPNPYGPVTGTAGADTIRVIGGSVTNGTGNVEGLAGSDTITITPTGGINSGNIVIGGSVLGGDDADTLNIGTVVGTPPAGSTVQVNGDVDGGSGGDTIVVGGNPNVATTIGGNVLGGVGVDNITLNGATVTGNVDGGDDGDTINLLAGSAAQALGGAGADSITLNGATITGNIDGGTEGDTINLTSGSAAAVLGGAGIDQITLNGATIAGNIDGGTEADTINLTSGSAAAVLGGAGADQITLNGATISGNIDGGTEGDTIDLTSGSAAAVLGGAGVDIITLKGATIAGNIEGGDDGDTINLTSGSAAAVLGDAGADHITLNGATISGNIDGGADVDTIDLLKGSAAQALGGAGADIITLNGATIGSLIDGGTEADNITLTSGTVGTGVAGNGVFGGDGGDTLTFNGNGFVNNATQKILTINGDVDGGTGVDTLNFVPSQQGRVTVTGNVDGGADGDNLTFSPTGSGQVLIGGNVLGGAGNDTLLFSPASTALVDIDGNIDGGDGDDTLTFTGVNGSNFALGGDVRGDGTATGLADAGNDTMNVNGGSNISFGQILGIDHLNISGHSAVSLTATTYDFRHLTNGVPDGNVTVGGDSALSLAFTGASLTTDHFELQAGTGYYAPLFTGNDAGLLANYGGLLDVSGGGLASNTTITAQGPSTYLNNGTILLTDGFADDQHNIVGNYVGGATFGGPNGGGGNLLLDTYVYNAASATDLLTINGNVSGTTTIYVNNLNEGAGTFTGHADGDGIRLVDVTGNSPVDGFQLAQNQFSGGRELLVGAFSYQLVQSQSGPTAGDEFLQSSLLESVPGYVTVSSAAQRHFYAGVDTLYKRLGELKQQDALEGRNADLAMPTKAPAYVPAPAPQFQMWGRGGGSDLSYEVDKGWNFDQQTYGFQIGGDYTFDLTDARVSIGAFGGYGWSDADVYGDFGSRSRLKLDGWNAGAYATIRQVGGSAPGVGGYADFVFKYDSLDVDINADRQLENALSITANTNASVWGGSGEVGYGFDVGSGFVIQPQAQLTYANVSQDDYTDSYGLRIRPEDADSLIGRLGIQLQTTIPGINGQSFTPWAVFNVLSEFMGDNDTNVAGTVLTSDIGGTWYNAGLGFNAAITENVALYGSGEYNFGDVEGWAGTGGIKVRW
jgi:outer membrane autotransporter protein